MGKVGKPPVDSVHVTGYFGREMGLGVAARGYIRALDHLGIPIVLHDLSHRAGPDPREITIGARTFETGRRCAVNLVCANAREHFQVMRELGNAHFLDHTTIGVWAWELATFPTEWHDRFAFYDEIWVGSSFVANALAPISPIPIVRVPPVVEPATSGSRARGREQLGIADDEFVFLFIFSFHSIFERKNPLAVIDAFQRAFTPDEAVRLVIKCVNEDFGPDRFARMQAMARGSRISIHAGYWAPGQMRDLMAASDAYASLHRAEGFGLTIAEAMAQGKPVIATAWSGNTDYVNETNSFPVRHRLVQLERDYGPYRAGETWAEPAVEHAAEQMRRVYENRDEARARGQAAQADIASTYATERVARLVQQRLAIIGRRQNGRPRREKVGGDPALERQGDEAASAPEPSGVILYVVGGVGPHAHSNSALRDFPPLTRRGGESPAGHLARVVQEIAEAMAAGGTHLLVPPEHVERLGDHPLVCDHLSTHHELAEAGAETGIVFRLISPGGVDRGTAGRTARGANAKRRRKVADRVDQLELQVARLQTERQREQIDHAIISEKLAKAQLIVDSVPAIAQAVAQVSRIVEAWEHGKARGRESGPVEE